MAELRGLGDVHRKLEAAGGAVLAISADPVDKAKKVRDRHDLPFDVLSDPDLNVIKSYGLVFHDPYGRGDISLPANILIDRNGTIVWKHVADRVQDRPHPRDVAAEVDAIVGRSP